MLLISFLEATADYLRLKSVRDGEKQVVRLEKAMKKDVARLFRTQSRVFFSHLPDKFDYDSASDAWELTQLETYQQFRELLVRHGRRAAYTGIRTLEKELSVDLMQEEAKHPANTPYTAPVKKVKQPSGNFSISFDEFDIDAYTRIEQHAGEKITKINDTTRKEIRDIISSGFKGEVQPDGTTKYKSYSQIAKDIKDKFSDFSAPVPQGHLRNRAEMVAVNEIRDGYETSKAGVRDTMEARGWQMLKSWNTMGDSKVSELCRNNSDAGWIDNKASFPSGHQHPPGHVACRCNCQSKVGSRKEQSGLPQDRWLVTRKGDTVTIKPNPKYKDGFDIPASPTIQPNMQMKTSDELHTEVQVLYNQKRDEYKRLKDAWNDQNNEFISMSEETRQLVIKASNIVDDDEYLKLKTIIDAKKADQLKIIDARNKIYVEIKTFKKKGREEIYETLSHEMGGNIKSNIASSPALQKSGKVDEALSFLDRVVVPDVQKVIEPNFKASNIKRANAAYWNGTININAKDNVGTAVHEMGHLFEKDENIFKAVNEFYIRRTTGEKSERLYKGKQEYTYKDNFINPYTGKIYRWTGANDPSPASGIHLSADRRDATEVISMGAQHLYEMPGEFAIKDPDHFKFMLDIFRGIYS